MGKKLKAYPPRPKEKARKETWDRYYERIKAVDRENADLVKEISQKKDLIKKINEHIRKSPAKVRARKKSGGTRKAGWF